MKTSPYHKKAFHWNETVTEKEIITKVPTNLFTHPNNAVVSSIDVVLNTGVVVIVVVPGAKKITEVNCKIVQHPNILLVVLIITSPIIEIFTKNGPINAVTKKIDVDEICPVIVL